MSDGTRSSGEGKNPAQAVIDAALEARSRGWRVIELYGVGPDGKCHCKAGRTKDGCKSAGKHPRLNDWQNAPQLSAPDIHEIWRARPKANLGMATGTDSGVWVLDIDPDNGGMESARKLATAHPGAFGQTRVHETGSGGFHYLFKMPDFAIGNSRGRLGETVDDGQGGRIPLYPGIDVRGTGGQIVLPPSHTNKGDYTVRVDLPPGLAPDWLLDMIRPDETVETKAVVPQAVPVAPAPAADQSRFDKYVDRARGGVEEFLKDRRRVDANGWNNSTFEQACKLVELANASWNAYSQADVQADLLAWAPQDEGFTKVDVAQCYRSAINKVGAKARVAPEANMAVRVADEFDGWDSPDMEIEPQLKAKLAGVKPPSTPRAHPTRRCDDVGNAERLHDRHGKILRWVEQRGKYAVYRDGRWSVDDSRIAHQLAQQLMRELPSEAKEYSDIPEDGEKLSPRQQFLKWAKGQPMSARIEAALKELRGQPGMQARLTDFDNEPYLLNVTNGVVDLKTGALLKSKAAQMLMSQVPVAYDPAARAPKWEQFLRETLPSESMRAYLQRWVGYSLTGSMGEQAMLIHHGSGANGKSVFLQVMTAIMGDYGQVVPRSTLLVKDREGHPADVARMVGKRFLQTSETAAGRRLDEEIVKGLTGGEQQTARHMREEFFDFTPQGKIHYVTNHLPRLTDAESIWRRLHLVRWGVVIPEHARNKDLAQEIVAEEAAGVLAWAVRGTLDWLDKGGLDRPVESLADLQDYRVDQDEFGDFVESCLLVTNNDVDRSTTRELYEAYQAWCYRSGVKRQMHLQDFGRVMRERKFKSYRTKSERGYVGVVLQGAAVAPRPPENDIDAMFK